MGRASLFCPLIISLCLVIVLFLILEKRDAKSAGDKNRVPNDLRVLSDIVQRLKIETGDGPISRRKFECPHKRPVIVKLTATNIQNFECGPPIACSNQCYKSSTCVASVGPVARKDFVSKLSCFERNAEFTSCNFTCCYSSMYELSGCGNVTAERLEIATSQPNKHDDSTAVSRKEASFDLCYLKPKQGTPVCDDKRLQKRSIVNYQCKNRRPILVNQTQIATSIDPFYCGRKPCNATCYTDFSCTNERNDYYASKFQCLIANGDVEPYSFPYMVEVCGMKKVNGCEAIGWTPGGTSVQPDIATAPVGIAALANLGQIGRLNVKKEMTQLTRKGCDPIDLLVLLDNSGSLHSSGFFNEQTFVNGIFNYFNFDSTMGTNKSRAALMVFGDTTELLWDLTRYESDQNADAHLTRALIALEAAIEFWKQESPKKRSGVRKITLLVTDGFPNAPDGESSLQARQQRFSSDLLTLESVSGEQLYTSTTSIDLLINYPGLVLERTTFVWTIADLSQLAKTQVQQICLGIKATSTTTTTTPSTTSSTTSLTSPSTTSSTSNSSTSSSSSTSTTTSTTSTTSFSTTSTTAPTTTTTSTAFTSSTTTPATISTSSSTIFTTSQATSTDSFTSPSTTTNSLSTSSTLTTPSTTTTTSELSTATSSATTTTTTISCGSYYQGCSVDSDCCIQGSSTLLYVLQCLGGKCNCGFPSTFDTATFANSCCDKQPTLPAVPIDGFSCPTGIHYSSCYADAANASCGAGLFCSPTPEMDNLFGSGSGFGICLSSGDTFYG